MRTASGQALGEKGSRERRRVRKRPKPATLVLAGLTTLVVLGLMIVTATGSLFGFWPPRGPGPAGGITPDIQANATQEARIAAISASGLKVEKAGAPRKEGDQVIVQVKVTNNLKISAPLAGTPTPDAATPTAAPANLLNGTVKVLFYAEDTSVKPAKRQLVGGAYGNVLDLPYGQSKTIDVVATGIGEFNDYEVIPDAIWTDKDAVKPSNSGQQQPAANPQPTP